MEEILKTGFEELGVPLRAGAAADLRRYWQLLEEKNRVMNLTAITGETDCARLHFLDCGALLGCADFAGARCIDIGSGAGFPGLVLKILEPKLHLTMLDSLRKRVDFQEEVCAALGITGVKCIHGRAEEAAELKGRFDIATSRAVARLNLLCELCLPFLKQGGLFVAMKGPEPEEELEEAQKAIRVLGAKYEKTVKYTVPGTDAVHSAVLIRKVGPTPPQYPRRWAKIQKSPL
ncbi:MAG: 16S rRNA (guanine(527)-N(7))-methyltransferase RsmG [Ruminococcaceae bacterium]|nr:16S rRNA (guanine(527)-N(7))-methyltransferase RsmG [Oscillospiraceae bacterium]